MQKVLELNNNSSNREFGEFRIIIDAVIAGGVVAGQSAGYSVVIVYYEYSTEKWYLITCINAEAYTHPARKNMAEQTLTQLPVMGSIRVKLPKTSDQKLNNKNSKNLMPIDSEFPEDVDATAFGGSNFSSVQVVSSIFQLITTLNFDLNKINGVIAKKLVLAASDDPASVRLSVDGDNIMMVPCNTTTADDVVNKITERGRFLVGDGLETYQLPADNTWYDHIGVFVVSCATVIAIVFKRLTPAEQKHCGADSLIAHIQNPDSLLPLPFNSVEFRAQFLRYRKLDPNTEITDELMITYNIQHQDSMNKYVKDVAVLWSTAKNCV